MQFRVLGPLELRTGDGELVALRAPKHRHLLAMLLLQPNQPVPADRLVEALWSERPPPSVRSVLRTYVSTVRATLSLRARDGGPALQSTPGGYRLRLPADQLDLLVFQRLAREGERARSDGDMSLAAERLHGALTLWRGRVAEDVPVSGPAVATVAGLEEQRLTAHEAWIETRLALGRPEALIPDLRALMAEHPLRERLASLLMLALYHSGRQADALALYVDIRRLLIQEVGVEPGPDLQRVHREILAHDVQIPRATNSGRRPTLEIGSVVPRQLPAPVRRLVGRTRERALLAAMADEATRADTSPMTALVEGPPGMGKTALAVAFAHEAAPGFPDGQLYVNLRGFAPGGKAVDAAEAVRGFLEGLGTPPESMPVELQAQIGLYRSLLAGRRMLIVLDNALATEQVRPLLPGTPGCLTLVTSRRRLTGLVVADGARPVVLDPLSPSEARQLLADRLGPAAVAAQQSAVDRLVESYQGLPLALVLVGARRTQRADRFPETHDGLDGFDTGDPCADLREILSWSYRAVSCDAARLFRAVGLHPEPSLSVPAMASLAAAPCVDARSSAVELVFANLLNELGPDRYTCHRVLHAYAAELGRAVDRPVDRDAARRRLLDHYAGSAWLTRGLLDPARRQEKPISVRPGVTLPEFSDPVQAMTWLAVEHRALRTAEQWARADGLDGHLRNIRWALARVSGSPAPATGTFWRTGRRAP